MLFKLRCGIVGKVAKKLTVPSEHVGLKLGRVDQTRQSPVFSNCRPYLYQFVRFPLNELLSKLPSTAAQSASTQSLRNYQLIYF